MDNERENEEFENTSVSSETEIETNEIGTENTGETGEFQGAGDGGESGNTSTVSTSTYYYTLDEEQYSAIYGELHHTSHLLILTTVFVIATYFYLTTHFMLERRKV